MSLETVSPLKLTIRPDKQEAAPKPAENDTTWGGDGFGFDDFIDLINPLQHIPGVSHVYQAITGDTIADEARIIGGALIGGPLGLATSIANVVIKHETGSDTAEHMMAMFDGETSSINHTGEPRSLLPANLPPPNPSELTNALPATQTLSALDFDPTPEPAEVVPSQAPGSREPSQNDLILQLFGQEVAEASQSYQNAQMLSFVKGVAKDLRA